jgi:hypothetical protein
VKQDADATRERSGDRELHRTDHRHVVKPEIARRAGGELAAQIGRDREDGAEHALRREAVSRQQGSEKLSGRLVDQHRLVCDDRGRPTQGADGRDAGRSRRLVGNYPAVPARDDLEACHVAGMIADIVGEDVESISRRGRPAGDGRLRDVAPRRHITCGAGRIVRVARLNPWVCAEKPAALPQRDRMAEHRAQGIERRARRSEQALDHRQLEVADDREIGRAVERVVRRDDLPGDRVLHRQHPVGRAARAHRGDYASAIDLRKGAGRAGPVAGDSFVAERAELSLNGDDRSERSAGGGVDCDRSAGRVSRGVRQEGQHGAQGQG